MKLAGVVIGVLCVAGPNAWAWEVDCYAPPSFPTVRAQAVELKNYAKCSSDDDFAYGHRLGEHYDICWATFESLMNQQLDASGATILSHTFSARTLVALGTQSEFIWSSNAYKGSSFAVGDLKKLPTTSSFPGVAHWMCEFAALPDQSMGLIDWAKGMQVDDCVGGAPCRTLEVLGPINSNHFGEQAAVTYLGYHNKAISIIKACKAQADVELATRKQYFATECDPSYFASSSLTCPSPPTDNPVAFADCFALGLLYEIYGQHYLQDRWAMGHMWNGWGAPRYDAFDGKLTAGAVALIRGIVHGAEAKTGVKDGLGSATPRAKWGLKGTSGRFAGVGDLHLNELLTDPALATQKDWLIRCATASLAEAMAGGQPDAKITAMRIAAPLETCIRGPWATNASMADALTVAIGPTVFTPENLAVLTGGASAPVMILANLFGLKIDATVFSKHFVPAAKTIRQLATGDADGLNVAQGPPPIDKIQHGGQYIDLALKITTLPDLNLPFDFSKEPAQGTADRALISRTRPIACQLLDRDTVNSFITNCQKDPANADACGVCISVVARSHFVKGQYPSECQIELGKPYDAAYGYEIDKGACWEDAPPCKARPGFCAAAEPTQMFRIYDRIGGDTASRVRNVCQKRLSTSLRRLPAGSDVDKVCNASPP